MGTRIIPQKIMLILDLKIPPSCSLEMSIFERAKVPGNKNILASPLNTNMINP